ncbi:MAG: DUF1161 domain-containing protein [Nitrospirae bacterium]|nr:DUF1161 domain-containing protein [Nitrospirota bacterium]
MKKFIVVLAAALSLVSLPALAAKKPCDELKAEIAAKLDAKGVKGYTLEIVAPENVKDAKVVGTCDGNTKRIIYKRN